MEHGDIYDKQGNPIHQEDYVFTRIRGGTHEGKVRQISTDLSINQESKFLGVFFNLHGDTDEAPLKVLFKNKDGRIVAHNPETLEIFGENS
ncbi:uncharacterized protein N7469_009439 [Penicillium citrinum]|uniref:Hypervirulence associated protein TUDOR domain-containing protein n=2 Tax=Penicillium TaxID=5073 RepID=A0A9W9NNH2_PENCI|nr:uncharacterized protein N7469_009439 [Penicillium citrinum]KAJ5223199.1 hypothetical protein N7469_009439 [Penicillium citrinum]KAJ5581369.1 hypothetical protein N7450_007670 [Penicillium hetheringtonii]